MNNIATICGGEKYVTAFQLYDGTILNCMILDTAGQERFDALNTSYYRKADAILLVYDISNKKSFNKIKKYYIKKIKENCIKDIPVLLLGNKTDKEDKREVTYEEGIALALQEKYEFNESSCLKNKNVAGAFEALIERWNFENHRMQSSLTRSNSKDNIKKKTSKNFKRCFTTVNLEKEIKNVNSQRNRSYAVLNTNERVDTIKLTTNISKKKTKKKCC